MRQFSTVRAVADPAADVFARLYPMETGILSHGLADHPLLTLEALADAAERMPPKYVEVRRGDAGPGGAFEHIRDAEAAPADVIRSIADRGCWVMLRYAEQLPEYHELLEQTLAPYADAIAAQTGEMRDCRAFIFVSSDAMVAPYHTDAEYNILFQIRGEKSFRTFPLEPPFMSAEDQERMHMTGDNLLPWDDSLLAGSTDHRLSPGDALYVPYKAPHMVTVVSGPSISLSLTWKSDWSLAQDGAYRFNAAMRQLGLRPRDIPAWPARTPGKTLASKGLRWVRVTP